MTLIIYIVVLQIAVKLGVMTANTGWVIGALGIFLSLLLHGGSK